MRRNPARRRTRLATFALACLLGATQEQAQAQTESAVLQGIVISHDGRPIAAAPVRAVNDANGTDARAYSRPDGRFELSGLPAADYVVSVMMPCCAYVPYVREGVRVAAGAATELEIRLEEGGSLNVLGDDPGTIAAELKSRQTIPDAPAPRMANGTPDLSGVWLVGDDPFPTPAVALPWAEAISQERIASDFRDHPHTRCLPSSPPVGGGATPFIAKFVQTPELLVILFEDVPGFRQVFLDGREPPDHLAPSWFGYSVGRFDGDTLVVETTGFNDRGWSGSYPRTEQMRLEERYTRTAYGTMEVRTTTHDPGVFAEPWVRVFPFDLAPDEELIEFVCENNKWAPGQ